MATGLRRPHVYIGEPDTEDASKVSSPLADCLVMRFFEAVEVPEVAQESSSRSWHALQDDPGSGPFRRMRQES